jgi:hypothetical protein
MRLDVDANPRHGKGPTMTPSSAPQTVAIFGPNLSRRESPTGATFVVHAAGCADCRKLRDAERSDIANALSLTELVVAVYPPSDFCYDPASDELDAYLGDFHFAPCVTLPVAPAAT